MPWAPGFLFRHLDRVAVKGKTRSLDIYELIGDPATPLPPHVAVYEQALEAWFQGDFSGPSHSPERSSSDPPSAFLAARCRAFIASPPPADWGGVYAFDSK